MDLRRGGRQAGNAAGDGEVLGGGELVLHRRRVAEVDEVTGVFLAQRLNGGPVPAHLARARREQAAQDAQQAGLAAAVRAGDAQRLARRERERERAEQLLSTALAL